MAAIVTGTVVIWDIDSDGRPKHVRDKAVSVFFPRDETGDDVADAQVLALFSQFLLDEVEQGKKPDEVLALVRKARDGLLQVVGIQRTSVQPPPRSTVQSGAGTLAQRHRRV
jgi:hypothetical protein